MEPERKRRVLFLCTGNSARSQMAEAILRHHAGDRFEAVSAGTEPRDAVHPLTLRVLDEMDIDIDGLRPKHTREFLGRVQVTYAVTVCDRAQKSCPNIYPFALQCLYWPFDDPATAEGDEFEQLAVFRRVRDEIDSRVQLFLKEEGR